MSGAVGRVRVDWENAVLRDAALWQAWAAATYACVKNADLSLDRIFTSRAYEAWLGEKATTLERARWTWWSALTLG